MITIRLSKNATDFLRRETEYLRQRNPYAALKFSQQMKAARRTLQAFPMAGNRMHSLQIANSLTLVSGDYLLEYLVQDEIVDIIAIRHGRMSYLTPDVDLDPEF